MGQNGHFGPFWAKKGHFGPFWAILALVSPCIIPDIGLYWAIWAQRAQKGPFWAILGHFGPFWALFRSWAGSNKRVDLKPIRGPKRPVWAIWCQNGPKMVIFDPFLHHMAQTGRLGSRIGFKSTLLFEPAQDRIRGPRPQKRVIFGSFLGPLF